MTFVHFEPGNIDEQNDGRYEEQGCHTEGEERLPGFQDFLGFSTDHGCNISSDCKECNAAKGDKSAA